MYFELLETNWKCAEDNTAIHCIMDMPPITLVWHHDTSIFHTICHPYFCQTTWLTFHVLDRSSSHLIIRHLMPSLAVSYHCSPSHPILAILSHYSPAYSTTCHLILSCTVSYHVPPSQIIIHRIIPLHTISYCHTWSRDVTRHLTLLPTIPLFMCMASLGHTQLLSQRCQHGKSVLKTTKAIIQLGWRWPTYLYKYAVAPDFAVYLIQFLAGWLDMFVHSLHDCFASHQYSQSGNLHLIVSVFRTLQKCTESTKARYIVVEILATVIVWERGTTKSHGIRSSTFWSGGMYA